MGFIWSKAQFLKSEISVMDIEDCVKLILTRCANALIGTNTGWSIDSTNHPNQDLANGNPIGLKSTNQSTYPCYAYYLINEHSGDKLMMLYNNGSSSTTYNPLYSSSLNDDCTSVKFKFYADSSGTSYNPVFQYYLQDLSLSIISSTYTSENFGEDATTPLNLLPLHATKLLNLYRYNYSDFLAGKRSDTSWGDWANYYFASSSTGDCVILAFQAQKFQSSPNIPINIYGKIYSSLCNTNDSDKYGAIQLWRANYIYSVYNGNFAPTVYPLSNGVLADISSTPYGTDEYINTSAVAHTKDGDMWLSGRCKLEDSDGTVKNANQFFMPLKTGDSSTVANYSQYASCHFTDGRPLKLPNPIVGFSYETASLVRDYGIVSGSGLKGVWDQNVISFIADGSTHPYTSGTILEDGNLMYTGAYGVCLGWDPSNSDDVNPYKQPTT